MIANQLAFNHKSTCFSMKTNKEKYPHPFLTPSLYSPHPLSIERWGYSKRGVRDRDMPHEVPMSRFFDA